MVGTTHPGNIGAAARAMNNMCFSRLSLVSPECPVGEIAYARSSGAHAVLDQRRTFGTLAEAVADCHLVIGLSARQRSLPWPVLDPARMAEKIVDEYRDQRVALVFGRENSGLTNEELTQCNYMVSIPSNPAFSSLNVAAAIQVICYEIYRTASAGECGLSAPGEPPATSGEVEGYIHHLQRILLTTGFLDPDNPGLLMQRLRRLYQRVGLSRNEVNILRGILTAVDNSMDSQHQARKPRQQSE